MMAADSSTLAGLLSAEGGERPAVVVPERELSVSRTELSHDVWRLAEALVRGGVEPQAPVSIVLANGLEFIVSFLATCSARAIAAPLNPAYKADEFKFYMEDAGSRAIILPPGPHPVRGGERTAASDLGSEPRQPRKRTAGASIRRPRQRAQNSDRWTASRRRGIVPAHERHNQPPQGSASDACQFDGLDPQHR